ncbi:MAG: hypothetical protein IV100_30950 [Myxococcales bacterium]|nr:hypothetical protein [Myxococcales bacterium]
MIIESSEHSATEQRRVAAALAEAHRQADPTTSLVLWIPGGDPSEIRLLEVSGSVSTINEVVPFRFPADAAGGIPYSSTLILLSEEEWGAVQDGRLPLPPGWDTHDAIEL